MKIESLEVGAWTVPTEEAESDATLTWTKTTVVTVEAHAGGTSGLGFTYATAACAPLIRDVLAVAVVGADPMDVPGCWSAMVRSARNLGRAGLVSMAIAAVDTALWDLKAQLLDQPLSRLLGAVREQVPVYGSGGFTSLSDDQLVEQLTGWTQGDGIPRVKLEVGTDRGGRERRDLERVALARQALDDEVELYVDANGGYGRKQAVRVGRTLTDLARMGRWLSQREEAAAVLGAGRWQRLRWVVWPTIRAPLAGGALIVAAFVLGALEVPLAVGPSHPPTLATFAYDQPRLDLVAGQAKAAAALLVAAAASIALAAGTVRLAQGMRRA